MEYTKEQKEFLNKKYNEAFKSAKAKIELIEKLGDEAYNPDGQLKPEYKLTYDEKATLSMPSLLFEEKEEEKGKRL